MGVFDWKHWIVLLVVVVLVFGTKKLKNFGGDLGESIKGFRKAMNEEESKSAEQPPLSAQPVSPMQTTQQPTTATHQGHIIEGQAQPAQGPQRRD
ncbi:twin-arginine translocase TatA/TatE family subunit [Pseudomonas putida]|jgi:sec-independent protein translocase protein TatA|uniref:twin-arginine translocase TatA/TatE family subunit n=1 Tax=Pseudomonas TaxID=286 RepID=UPI00345D17EF